MMRRTLCVGDKPETGGEIQPLEILSYTINGHQPAIVGGKALCLACNSIGTIAKAGGSRRHVHCWKELALDGDVLLCKCERPPQMLASMQSLPWFEDSGERRGERGSARDVKPVPSSRQFDEQVLATKNALEGYPYFVEVPGGQSFSGRLDASARLPRIYTQAEESYEIYWGEEALTMGARH
ncbi:PAAR domain-containing protein [Paraburkholderia bannensis]|uniref:PAAR domain-containing protein n=1 Tax=Paraburkholderia bannensis TaxID=765414 RepID=UPI002AB114FA|nr:PAAR domain-containing protein [Paraburkholderia bannensis]